MSLSDVRSVFDTVIEQYPSTARFLATSATIVVNENFENGVVKILSQSEAIMNDGQTQSACDLIMDQTTTAQCNEGLSIIQRSKRS